MVNFISKRYVCKNCSYTGKVLLAYKDISEILSSSLPSDWPSESLDETAIYEQQIIRESDDFLPAKKVIRSTCSKCNSEQLDYLIPDNMQNVLNFYPATLGEKYLTGFDKQM